jgi:lipoprotein-anchoring transpeptidase ErfK/SrfK
MRKLHTLLLLFLLLCCSLATTTVHASPVQTTQTLETLFPKPLSLGTLSTSTVLLDFDGIQIELFEALDSYYIPLTLLNQLGYPLSYFPETGIIELSPSKMSTLSLDSPPPTLLLEDPSYKLYTKDIYLGNFKTYGIMSSGRVFVPLESLEYIFDITPTSKFVYEVTPKKNYFYATPEQVYNGSAEPLFIQVTDLYWSADGLVEKAFIYYVDALHTADRLTAEQALLLDFSTNNPSLTYITSICFPFSYAKDSPNETDAPNELDLNSLDLPTTYNEHTAFSFAGARLFTHATDTTKKQKDLSKKTSDYGDVLTLQEVIKAEESINKLGLSSPTKYLVWTDTGTQKTYIFEGRLGNWKLLKHFICSTGKSSTPTPKGTFALTYKVPYFGVEKGYRCKNAFGFIGTKYLYHSILFDATGTYLLEGKGVLGKAASDGCIRFSPENSEWFYNNLISGTTVFIN